MKYYAAISFVREITQNLFIVSVIKVIKRSANEQSSGGGYWASSPLEMTVSSGSGSWVCTTVISSR